MKIYSWNILYKNERMDDVVEFIQAVDADLFCMQEVPASLLPTLRELPYNIATTPEYHHDNKSIDTHLVILSKHEIIKEHTFTTIDRTDHPIPLRTRLFFLAMKYTISEWPTDYAASRRHGLYVDIAHKTHGEVRVFCVHPLLTYPNVRAVECAAIFENCDTSKSVIVCGDFNIIERINTTILNWLLGGNIADTLLWWRERKNFEKQHSSYGFSNPHRSTSTHEYGSQLDHILVCNIPHTILGNVHSDRIGSDHHPICVEIHTTKK